MSEQFSSFGTQPEPPAGDLTAFTDGSTGRRLDGKVLRALIAGAAAVAVLGGGGLGFAWLSSTPGGADAQAAVVPAARPTSSTVPGDGTTPPAFAGSGRDIFAGTVAPAPVGDAVSDGSEGAGTASSSTAAGSAAAAGGSGASSGSGSGTSASGVPSKPAATTGAAATPGASAPSSTPAPSKSTALPWQRGVVKFVEIADGSVDGTGNFSLDAAGRDPVFATLAFGDFVPSTSTVYRPQGIETDRSMNADEAKTCDDYVRGASAAEAEARNRATKSCTVVKTFVYQAVFTPSSQTAKSTGTEGAGWVVPAGALLPDAALGKVEGAVRWLGSRDELFLVQVGNGTPQWVKKGEGVTGTPLTFSGIGLAGIARTDVAVFSDGTNQYFTVLGGGERSGVSF